MSGLTWFKSSDSDSSGGECVEVAATQAAVHVRDSKDVGGCGTLRLTPDSWHRLVSKIRPVDAGQPDLNGPGHAARLTLQGESDVCGR